MTMEKILPFFARHWFLVLLFLIALVWLIFEESRSKGRGGSRLTPELTTQLINRENAVVLDIREAGFFNDGHITGALNIPLEQLDRSSNRLEKYKEKPVVIVCNTGQKAGSVMNKLRKQGYTKVYVLAGGITAWKNANMPLVKN